jgi:hypothetical protein
MIGSWTTGSRTEEIQGYVQKKTDKTVLPMIWKRLIVGTNRSARHQRQDECN